MNDPDLDRSTDHTAHAPHAYRPVRILWWVYFALIAVYWMLAVLTMHSPLDALQAAFWAVSLVGLWGYLRHLAIGGRRLWMIYLPLFVTWVLANIVMRLVHAPQAGLLPSLIAAFGIVLMFGLSAWALWRYAFRCPKIWRTPR